MKNRFYHKWYFRLFVILILPILFSFFFLFSLNERIPIISKNVSTFEGIENLTVKSFISEEDIFKPGLKNTLRNIFGSSFNLELYHICFENRGTRFIYATGEEDKNVTTSVNFENLINLSVPFGQTNCTTNAYKVNQGFTYNWHFEYSVDLSKAFKVKPIIIPENETVYWRVRTIGTFSPDTDSYAKPELTSVITKNILFVISYVSLFWLGTRVFRIIKWGFLS